jgi:hypothetical protein
MLKSHWRIPMMNDNIKFRIAEVKSGYDTTYLDENPSDLYTIFVQPYDTSNKQNIPCRPASNSIKQIPLVGEHVLIFKGISQFSSADVKSTQWYYFNPYPIQSGINSNILPTISQPRTGDVSQPVVVVEDTRGFEETAVSPIQPYQGDSIFEGRWGNSLRLSSTCFGGNYTISPPWDGQTCGDPITILSNGRQNPPTPSFGSAQPGNKRKFTVETPDSCDSALYLTSTQKISKLELSLNPGRNPGLDSYDKPQLIGVADRIVLSARNDKMWLGAKDEIIVSTNKKIRLGHDDAINPVIKGNDLVELLRKLITLILEPRITVSGGPALWLPDQFKTLLEIQGKLDSLKSTQVFIKK